MLDTTAPHSSSPQTPSYSSHMHQGATPNTLQNTAHRVTGQLHPVAAAPTPFNKPHCHHADQTPPALLYYTHWCQPCHGTSCQHLLLLTTPSTPAMPAAQHSPLCSRTRNQRRWACARSSTCHKQHAVSPCTRPKTQAQAWALGGCSTCTSRLTPAWRSWPAARTPSWWTPRWSRSRRAGRAWRTAA